MYIARAKWESKNGKVYESVWLRQSYHEGGQVKTRNVANLKHCRPEEIDAIELALKYKGDLAVLGARREVKLKEGLSVGAVWTVYEVARGLGIEKVLGGSRAGKLALWQALARVLAQGSRLSAVRLAQLHAACDVLGMRRGFSENALYENLRWLSERQTAVERVTFVGDRGMIKSGQVEELAAVGFHYITAITKPQIETLLKSGALQMELFDERVCEVELGGLRYILRRNPLRAAEMAATRADKQARVERLVEGRNLYLAEHPRARLETAERIVREKIHTLKLDKWLSVKGEGRRLALDVDEDALAQAARLDGCYVIKTDLPKPVAGTQTIHDRYKDLSLVEQAFRTCKTAHLEGGIPKLLCLGVNVARYSTPPSGNLGCHP